MARRGAAVAQPDSTRTTLAELLCTVSYTGDLAMGQPLEHGLRTAYTALRVADAAGLSSEDRAAVYYGVLLKDVG